MCERVPGTGAHRRSWIYICEISWWEGIRVRRSESPHQGDYTRPLWLTSEVVCAFETFRPVGENESGWRDRRVALLSDLPCAATGFRIYISQDYATTRITPLTAPNTSTIPINPQNGPISAPPISAPVGRFA
jgi:hypothetical protein